MVRGDFFFKEYAMNQFFVEIGFLGFLISPDEGLIAGDDSMVLELWLSVLTGSYPVPGDVGFSDV
jgi:hypothetical protein